MSLPQNFDLQGERPKYKTVGDFIGKIDLPNVSQIASFLTGYKDKAQIASYFE